MELSFRRASVLFHIRILPTGFEHCLSIFPYIAFEYTCTSVHLYVQSQLSLLNKRLSAANMLAAIASVVNATREIISITEPSFADAIKVYPLPYGYVGFILNVVLHLTIMGIFSKGHILGLLHPYPRFAVALCTLTAGINLAIFMYWIFTCEEGSKLALVGCLQVSLTFLCACACGNVLRQQMIWLDGSRVARSDWVPLFICPLLSLISLIGVIPLAKEGWANMVTKLACVAFPGKHSCSLILWKDWSTLVHVAQSNLMSVPKARTTFDLSQLFVVSLTVLIGIFLILSLPLVALCVITYSKPDALKDSMRLGYEECIRLVLGAFTVLYSMFASWVIAGAANNFRGIPVDGSDSFTRLVYISYCVASFLPTFAIMLHIWRYASLLA